MRLHYTLLKQALYVTHARKSLQRSIRKECGVSRIKMADYEYGNAIAIFDHYTKNAKLFWSEHDTESIGMSTWSCSCVSSG